MRRDQRLDRAEIQASLRAVDPAALMPLHLLRLRRQWLERVYPEYLLELLAGLRVWCRDGVVQLAGHPAGMSDWEDRVLFGPFIDAASRDDSPASLRLLHLGQGIRAVSAEVRRRREASTLEEFRAALDDPAARSRFLRPYLSALYRKWRWRTAADQADLANRMVERLTRFLDVASPVCRRPSGSPSAPCENRLSPGVSNPLNGTPRSVASSWMISPNSESIFPRSGSNTPGRYGMWSTRSRLGSAGHIVGTDGPVHCRTLRSFAPTRPTPPTNCKTPAFSGSSRPHGSEPT